MLLTDDEQKMLAGDFGPGVALAMKVLVGIGEAFGAERMVPISRAHVALSNQEADLWFVEKLVKAGARCRVTPTVNPGFSLDFFQDTSLVTDQDVAMMKRTFKAYQALGAQLSFSCTPYLLDNIPRWGEVLAFSESSATPYVNSVWGARSNRESAQSALCAAVTGCVPEYGLLLPPERRARAVVEVEADMSDDFAYSLLGWLTPKRIGPHLPVFTGLPSSPRPEALMNLGAELNTAGATAMYHIAKVTPEAPTLQAALGGQSPEKSVKVTDQDLREQLKSMFQPGGAIDFVMFGCPHHTIRQVQKTAALVEGKKLKAELWILTSAYTKEMARRMGLLQIIEKAGGRIVEDTCVDQPCWRHLGGKMGATDSPKCAYYTQRRNIRFVVRSLEDCLQASLRGEIE
ncbi:MAG: aconitase X catalytic domain-containing protein [Deltaproteobacteria bacterium]|nr:aconitase X catalytic domain-containing protein [Deltaproteobacteria bacterium]